MQNLLHEFLTHNIKKHYNNTVLIEENRSITYRELDILSNKMANMLISIGIKRGDIVGLYTKKDIYSVIAILGILKSGAAFLPINTNIPFESVKYIINECRSRIIIADNEIKNILSKDERIEYLETIVFTKQVVQDSKYRDIDISNIISFSEIQPQNNIISSDLAYIIYTSGSSGKPKGVMISHLGVTFVLRHRIAHFKFIKESTLLSLSPVYFDPIITELFTMMATGGKIVLFDDVYKLVMEKSVDFLYQFLDIIQSNKITLMSNRLHIFHPKDSCDNTFIRLINGGIF